MGKIEFVEEFKDRTRMLAVATIKFHDEMRKTDSSRIIGKQLIRSVTSTAANYRAACIARSRREFFAKMSIVVEEADETLFWLELLKDSELVPTKKVLPLIIEATEIAKVMSVARKNTSTK